MDNPRPVMPRLAAYHHCGLCKSHYSEVIQQAEFDRQQSETSGPISPTTVWLRR